jgi:hypothetical protein
MSVIEAKREPLAGPAVDPELQQRILDAYKKILWAQFGSTIFVIACVSILLLWSFYSSNENNSPPLLPLIVAAGMLGALFSALTRLYHVDQAGEAVVTNTVGKLGKTVFLYSVTPPLIGAIAAIVLFLLFGSGLVSSPLFPKIACNVDNGCKTIKLLMDHYWPEQPQDYCKALVWAFVAGFSERFVPDILQSVAGKATTKRRK